MIMYIPRILLANYSCCLLRTCISYSSELRYVTTGVKASFRYVDRIGTRLRYPMAAKERVSKGFIGSQGPALGYGKLLVWWIVMTPISEL
jgi:hypothetical protein